MKVSLNSVKDYTEVNLPVEELVEKIGVQLGAVEEVVDLGKKYEGIVVAKVISCVKHPDADKLSLCLIDDGGRMPNVERNTENLIQVVCGAPNVREGLLVAWLPPGSTVPNSVDKEPFVLEARELRGKVSNGMLASAHELAISDDHNGIVELDGDIQPGDDFAEVFNLNDYVIDIENKMFTHRPDCFGQLGVAREIAGIQQKAFASPDWYTVHSSFDSASDDQVKGLSIEVQIPELCPRYMAVVMSGIKVGPSPFWLQTYLSRVGIRPINNIVDMTNYMMVLTGQPLHAFDFDKVARAGEAKIIVRNPKEGEKLTLLDGKTIAPRPDAILICDQDKPIGLGGMMGGNNSEIDQDTTRIIIECANFNMYNIRRTSMEHGVFSDAVTRFNKGQSEWQCPPVLFKAVQMTSELCESAKAVSPVADVHKVARQNQYVVINAGFINERLGSDHSVEAITSLLKNVEFEVSVKNETLNVLAPFWRTDIEIPEDVVEEIGRLEGYDKLPLELPRRSILPASKNLLVETKNRIRQVLSEAGANELLTYSFVHHNLLEKAGQDKDTAYELSNALSPDLQYYRLSLTPSLLEKVQPNLKSDMVRSEDNEFALFEIGKSHLKGHVDDEGLPIEGQLLALVVTADEKTAGRKYSGSSFYLARNYLMYLSDRLGVRFELTPLESEPDKPAPKQFSAPFELKRSAHIRVEGKIIGLLGEYKQSVRQRLKLPTFTAGFELDLLGLGQLAPSKYEAMPRFPKVQQDMTLKVPSTLGYSELYKFIWEELGQVLPEATLPTLGPVDIYKSEKDHKNVTFRLWLSAYNRTLKAEEVNSLLDQLAAKCHEKFGAERI